MLRNVTYRKRNWLGTLLEIALPVCFIAILIAIKNATDDSDQTSKLEPAQYPDNDWAYVPLSFHDYVKAMQVKRFCERQQWDFNFMDQEFQFDEVGITGMAMTAFNWMVPVVKCDHRKCEDIGENATNYCEYLTLAVTGTDEGGMQRARDFGAWIYQTYPALNDTETIQFRHDFVQIMDSEEALEDYVKDSNYGTSDNPKVAMAVVFEGNDPHKFVYRLRQNSTNFNNLEEEARPAARTTPPTNQYFNSFAKDDSSCPEDENGGVPSLGLLQNSCTGQYLYNGVLTFQRLVGDYILHATGAEQRYPVARNGARFVQFPTPEYEDEGFFADIADFAPLLVTLGLLYPVAAMIAYVTREKELRQKELMKMMSVTESDIGWSWFFTFLLLHVLTATLTTVVAGQLFNNSDGGYLWFFWMMTFVSIITFSLAISAITSKSTRGVLLGLLIFFAGVILTFVLDYQEDNSGIIALVSLHPVAAFSFGLQEIAFLEDRGVGLRSSTIETSDYPSGYTFSDTVAALITGVIFWGVLSWYLNRVIPPDYGQAMPLYFPFTSSYWCPGSAKAPVEDASEETTTPDIPFEPVPETVRRQAQEGKSIEIRNLRRMFGDNIAVDGLSLSMYSGSITALLGHNGAGKTTTISMLTGVLSPTEGYALVAGKDIRTQQGQIRKNLGVCLQHDCLFPQLTVREHVAFFARIKGAFAEMSRDEANAHIDQSIADVALTEKRNTLSKNLSGGMKRKLSVAIAFCGGSKVVLLDEPTSGMDPFSRRFTWNVIRQYRKDRCIILTTHFMDEADILGDRIAIMSEGQLQCCGSSLFLKKTYGVGYQLVIEKQSGRNRSQHGGSQHGRDEADESGHDHDDTLKKIVTENVEDAALLNNVGTELSFQLPMSSSSQFGPMFEGLDEQVEKGTVMSYGVSITTLEEVFLLVARGHAAQKQEFASVSMRQSGQALAAADAEKSARSRMDLEKDGLLSRHIGALFKKRAAFFRRDKKAWMCTTILPSLFVLWGFLIFKFAPNSQSMDELKLNFDVYNRNIDGVRQPVVYNSASEPFLCQPGRCVYQEPFFNNSETGELYGFCGIEGSFEAAAFLGVDIGGGAYGCSITSSDDFASQISQIEHFEAVPVTVSNVSEASYALARSKENFAASQYGAIFFTHDLESSIPELSGNYTDYVVGQCNLVREFGDIAYTSEADCEKLAGVGYLIQYNYTALHASPLFQALVDQVLVNQYREETGETNEFTVDASLHPLPTTKVEAAFTAAQDATAAWILVVLSFPFIAGAFASFIVAERESKAKHLQTVAGVEPTAYWVSSLLWDTANYMVPCWIVVALMYAFDVAVLTTQTRNVASGVIAILVCFGPAAAGFSYVVSFAFTSPAICNVFVIVSGFLIGLGGPLTCFILIIVARDPGNPKPNLEDIANILTWCLRIFFPTFNLGRGLLNAINIEVLDFLYGESKTAWTNEVLLYDVIFLILQAIGFLMLAIQLDVMSTKPSIVSVWKKFLDVITLRMFTGGSPTIDITVALPEDEDVMSEQERVANGDANNDLIVLSQLTKVYDNGKVAVNNVSLGIAPGECFGLLGINGAGKTTTMGMMTAEFPPSSGDATLAGFSVTREPQKIRRRIGYCPQFDAHFTNLTGREHCELYASIKGVPKAAVKEAAETKLREVGLEEKDWDRLSAGYSGGMKRRLSLACATIGEPQIVFLDECSTGVDPVARREIWQLISDMVTRGSNEEERTSVVLTTHSMEECEALCPRIGIMANGRLRCLGSAQHLKNKFGQGFQVELKIKLVSREDSDYVTNATKILRSKTGANDEEKAVDLNTEEFFNLEETLTSLRTLTGDDKLASLVNAENPSGYTIWKDASAGVLTLDQLSVFATVELRMINLEAFIEANHPGAILRERQDTKSRYEVSSDNVRISSIFASIESHKEELGLADYGVSQTSLEQVFNMHAAEAERLKQGRNDR